METTRNLGICKPNGRWLDQHPSCGVDGVVSEALDSIDNALSGGGRFKTCSVAITSAQLLAMKGAPVVLVPGVPGWVVQPTGAMIQYMPVSVDYSLGDATLLYIGSAVNPISVMNVLSPISSSVLDGSSGPGNVIGLFPATNVLVTAQSWLENQNLVLTHNGSAELTLGDGTVQVTIAYSQSPV